MDAYNSVALWGWAEHWSGFFLTLIEIPGHQRGLLRQTDVNSGSKVRRCNAHKICIITNKNLRYTETFNITVYPSPPRQQGSTDDNSRDVLQPGGRRGIHYVDNIRGTAIQGVLDVSNTVKWCVRSVTTNVLQILFSQWNCGRIKNNYNTNHNIYIYLTALS